MRKSLFAIMGSDGLWDVLGNDEAAELVCGYLYNQLAFSSSTSLAPSLMHNAAKFLAQEAFVRGSSDNIAVYIIDMQ